MIGSTLGLGAFALTPAAASPSDTPSREALDQQINKAADQLEIVVEQYDAIRVQLDATKAKEATLARVLEPTRRAVAEAQAQVALIALRAYEATRFSGLVALIDAPTTAAAICRMTTLSGLTLVRRQQIKSLYAAAAVYLQRQQQLTSLDQMQSGQFAALKAKRATILAQVSHLRSLRLAAYGPSGLQATKPVPGYVPPFAPGPAGQAVKFAFAQIGKMYQWGAAGPNTYDCSGLTMAAWRSAGVLLPHNAAMQYATVAHIPRSELEPGDLVFYFTPIHHVAIYIGGDRVIQAPQFGKPVQISGIALGPIDGYGRPG